MNPRADIEEKQGGGQRISGWMDCFFAGSGLIDGGLVNIDFSYCGFYRLNSHRLVLWLGLVAKSRALYEFS